MKAEYVLFKRCAMKGRTVAFAVVLLSSMVLAGCVVNPVVPVTPVSPVGDQYVYAPYYYDYPGIYYLSPPVFGYYPYGNFGPQYYYPRH